MNNPYSQVLKAPSPDEIMSIMLRRACFEIERLNDLYPDMPVEQGVEVTAVVSSYGTVINVVPDEHGWTTAEHVRAMWVKGDADGDAPAREHFAVFAAPTEWHHTAWRVAFSNREQDSEVRAVIMENDPDGIVRLIEWLTPAGLRRFDLLKGDYSAHRELLIVDDYHQWILDNSDVVPVTQDVWV
jgi:hypothetical protein